MSQEDIAELTGVTVAWYGALERGSLDGHTFSAKFLDLVASSLELNASERRALHLLATGLEPPVQDLPRAGVSEATMRMLGAHPWPAYVCDEVWNLLASNDSLHRWCPQVPRQGANLMKLMFLQPECQRQLVDWDTGYATRALGLIRAQYSRMPEHPELNALIIEILRGNSRARALWEREPTVRFHEDGEKVELLLPAAERSTIAEVLTWEQERTPLLRVTMLVPVAGFIPEPFQLSAAS